MTCTDVGSDNPDIAGIGIIIAFALQALLSILFSLWSFFYSEMLGRGMFRENEYRRRACMRKMEIINGILLFASDSQTLNGIALLISGLSQIKDLDFYHLHLVYDIVNFTSVSNCAAISCSFKKLKKHRITRLTLISLFLVLYLAFVVSFGIRLRGWDETVPGHCYDTGKLSLADASHPYVDNIYLAITSFVLIGIVEWALISAFTGIFNFRIDLLRPLQRYADSLVLFYAVLQFTLHLYSVIVLREANEPLLQGDSENVWGFGQVVAVVMFGATIVECCKGYKEWYSWVDDP